METGLHPGNGRLEVERARIRTSNEMEDKQMFYNPCKFACWFSVPMPFGAGVIEVSNGGGNIHPRWILGAEGGWVRVNLL